MTEQISGDWIQQLNNEYNSHNLINEFDKINYLNDKLLSLLNAEKSKITMSIATTSETSFEVVAQIKNLDIITPEEIKKFKEAQAFALSNFRDVPAYRPMIVKLTSVLNDKNFPTADMKYWQCKSEAEVHFNELVRDYYKHLRSMVDLKELNYKIKEMTSILNKEVEPNTKFDPNLMSFDRERMEIKKNQYEYELKLLEKDIKYRIQEVVDWHVISSHLEKKCEYSSTDYQEHTIKGHIAALKSRLKDPNLKTEDRANYQNQLDTFLKLNKFS